MNTPEPIRIIVADHEPIALAGAEKLLRNEHPEFQVSKKLATTTEELRQIAMEFIPHIVLTNDHTLVRTDDERTLNAMEVIEHARGQYPVAAYLSYPEQSRVAMLHATGAKAVFSKSLDMKHVAQGMQEIVETGKHPSVKDEVDMQTVSKAESAQLQDILKSKHGKSLTARELEVALAVTRGLPNKLIAKELSISIDTAKEHVGNILHKLGIKDRTMVAVEVARILKEMPGTR